VEEVTLKKNKNKTVSPMICTYACTQPCSVWMLYGYFVIDSTSVFYCSSCYAM